MSLDGDEQQPRGCLQFFLACSIAVGLIGIGIGSAVVLYGPR